MWCHVKHINLVKIHPEWITREDKKLVNDLNCDSIEFPLREKDFSTIEKKKNICINVFCCENKLVFPIYVSNQTFENTMDLLLVTDGDKSHNVCIKDFERFRFQKTKNKTKNTFARVVYNILVVKMSWQNMKKFVWALMGCNV